MDHEKTSRRSVIGTILKSAVFAYPLGSKLLGADAQPLVAQVGRLVQAMEYLGEPFSDMERRRLERRRTYPMVPARVKSSGCWTPSACRISASIRKAGSRSSAAPPRHGWWNRGGGIPIKVHNEAGPPCA
jgi:hypothetical protein